MLIPRDRGQKSTFQGSKNPFLGVKKHFLGVKKPFLRSQKMVMCFMYKSVLMDHLQFRNKNVLKCGKTSDLQAPALHTHLTQTRSDFSRDNIWGFFSSNNYTEQYSAAQYSASINKKLKPSKIQTRVVKFLHIINNSRNDFVDRRENFYTKEQIFSPTLM